MEINKEKIKEKQEEIKSKHKKLVRVLSICGVVLLLSIMAFVGFKMITAMETITGTSTLGELTKSLKTPEGAEAIKQVFSKYSGPGSILIFVFFQALQVIIAVIPPIQIVGGMLFGWLWGGLLSFAGTFLGTLAIFLLVHRFGRPMVEAFVDEKNMKKFKFLQNEKKLTHVLMVLYLIPGVPKDVISYIVPLTPISRRDFFMYVMPCRLPAIMLSTVLGNGVFKGNMTTIIITLSIAVVIGILGLLFKDVIINKMKRKKTSK